MHRESRSSWIRRGRGDGDGCENVDRQFELVRTDVVQRKQVTE